MNLSQNWRSSHISTVNSSQKLLLSAEYLFDINPLKKYQILFDNLNTSALDEKTKQLGRHPVPKPALLRALNYLQVSQTITYRNHVITDIPVTRAFKIGRLSKSIPIKIEFKS
jgi:hypothetical protein